MTQARCAKCGSAVFEAQPGRSAWEAFEAMREALKLCYANLLHRADSRSKWTQGDQNAFDKALSALRLADEVTR